MANDIRTALILDLEGNLPQQSRRLLRALDRLGQRGARSMKALGRATGAAGRAIDRLGNRYTALLTGGTALAAGRFVVGLERRFTRLGIQAGRTAEEMDRLKAKIFEIAQRRTIRIDPSELIAGIEKIVAKTGDLDFAVANLDNLAMAIGATGARGEDIGALVAEFRKMGIVLREDVLATLDMLARQGDIGAFELKDLATQGERTVSAFAGMGYQGQEAVKQMGALLQKARQGTGSAEEASTAFENLLKTVIEKGKDLQAAGITVFDPDKLKRGVEEFRPMPEIIEQIIRKAEGKSTILSGIFDIRAIRAVNVLAAEFKQSGGFAGLERFMEIQGDGAEINARAARAAKDAAAALRNLTTAAQAFADANLTAPVQAMADALNSMDPENVQKVMKALAYGAGGLGGLVIGRKLYRGGRAAAGLFRGAPGLSGGGLAGLAAAGPTPVAVVNWPAAMMGGGPAMPLPGGPGKAAGRAARAGRLGRTTARLGRYSRGAGIVGALLAGAALLGIVTDPSLSGRQKAVEGGAAAGGLGGALAGAEGGAAVGTLILPGIGTAVGTAAGGLLGYLFGEKLGRTIAESLATGDGGGGSLSAGERRRARHGGRAEVTLKIEGAPARVQGITADGIDVAVDSGLAMVP